MNQYIDIDSYVVYTANGETFHRRPACASRPGTATQLDHAASAFGSVEDERVENVGHDPDDYCKNCCSELLRHL